MLLRQQFHGDDLFQNKPVNDEHVQIGAKRARCLVGLIIWHRTFWGCFFFFFFHLRDFGGFKRGNAAFAPENKRKTPLSTK